MVEEKFRKELSMDALLAKVCDVFTKVETPVNCKISTKDCLMSALAIFGLKSASIHAFRNHLIEDNLEENLKNLYLINQLPSDTQIRERLDIVDLKYLRPAFKKLFASVQRGGVLADFKYLDDYYLVSNDGTGYFSSNKIHCENCCEKEHRNGAIEYYHQMLCSVIVHPEKRQVIPFMPEFIFKQDGANKNDCETNATKRQLENIRREHPHLKICVVEDALFANAPHIQTLNKHDMRYIIGCKSSDHRYLFSVFDSGEKFAGECNEDGVQHDFEWANNLPLNKSNQDVRVNLLSYTRTNKKGKTSTWTWITDFEITLDNVYKIMRGGRARWKIENETFNTLKNQGYNFEHNFGHGYAHLSHVLATLMLLAFSIDQLQMLTCKVFQAAKEKSGAFYLLWENMRGYFKHIIVKNWSELLYKIAYKSKSTYKGASP